MALRVPSEIRKLRALLKGIAVGMLTPCAPLGESHSRPMLVQEIDSAGWLWFLTDRTSRKACELARNPEVSIVFQSSRGDRLIAVHGVAVVIQDDVKVKRMWNPTYRAWFPRGPRGPEIALIAVRITTVDFWLVPRSRIVRGIGAMKALVTGRRYEAGKRGTLHVARLAT